MQMTTILGLVIGLGGILIGNAVEGGSTGSLFQLTAGLIVFAGTAGAVIISHRREDLSAAVKALREVFRDTATAQRRAAAKRTIKNAQVVRRESLLALEKALANFDDPFMRTVYRFAIDGVDASVLRTQFESEIVVGERRKLAAVKVWSDAGGFAPTIGIIGAVLGLISVMANISDTAMLGHGIAVAFVATVYGVGSANLFFLPVANKLKSLIKYRAETERMILEGALAIVGGLNPFLVEQKMRSYTGDPA